MQQGRAAGYVPQIDGLRAVAIIAVMIYHLTPGFLPGGFAGVDVFFVISGYVVSASLARDADHSAGQFLLRFYARRMARIVPPLLACLVCAAIAATMFIPNAWLSNTSQFTALFAFVGLGNAAMVWLADDYFSPRVEFNPYVHTWSLGVEEQFYLIFPLVFLVWITQRNRPSALRHAGTWLLAGILALSVAYAWRHSTQSPERAFYLLAGRLWELGMGAMVFQLQGGRKVIIQSTRGIAGVLWVGAGLILAGAILTPEQGYPFPWALMAVVGTVLLIAGVTETAANGTAIALALGSRPFVLVGKLSYSLYLWHWPVYVMHRWTVGIDGPLQATSAVAITALLAAASYYAVERPIRSHPLVRTLAPSRVIGAGIASIVLCVGIAISVFAAQGRISRSVTKATDSWYPSAPGSPREPAPPCRAEFSSAEVNGLEVRAIAPTECAQVTPRPQRLFVIGDSHALAYLAMLTRVTEDLGVSVQVYSNGGCSFANMHRSADTKWMECVRYYRAAGSVIAATAAPGDVVFLAGLRLNRLGDQWGAVDSAGGYTAPGSDAATQQRVDALAETAELVGTVGANGAHVVIDAPAPIFRSAAFRCSDWFNRSNSYCAGGLEIPRAAMQALRRPIVDSLVSLSVRVQRLAIWDPFPVLCPTATCVASDERGPLFFDGDHLSGTGNAVVYPSFAALLNRTWEPPR